jgi:small subunit ribosomal protein S4
MGEPKFSRRKYERPMNPWEAARIKAENEIIKKYGLKNKKELWRTESMLRGFREQSKDLQARLRYRDAQAQKETAQILSKLKNLSILPEAATLDDVLALNIDMILGRRLQTLVYLKGFAVTPSQARQLIVHGHACVNGRKVTVPGYLVKLSDEPTIGYNPKSPIANDMHPARPKKDDTGGAPPPAVAPPAQSPPPEQKPDDKKAPDAKPEPTQKAAAPAGGDAPAQQEKTEKADDKKQVGDEKPKKAAAEKKKEG